MSNLSQLGSLQASLVNARIRTGDMALATNASKGKLNVVRVTYDSKGISTVTPVREGLTLDETITFLDSLS